MLGFFELCLVNVPAGTHASLLIVDARSSITKTSNTNSTTKAQQQQLCSSPEYHTTPFPLKGDAISQTNSSITCGLQNSQDAFSKYMREIVRNNWLEPNLTQHCDIVVYGVALGSGFVQDVIDEEDASSSSSSQGDDDSNICFFMLTYQKDMPDRHGQPMKLGQYWFLPIPQWVFPYQNPRRNAKVRCFDIVFLGCYLCNIYVLLTHNAVIPILPPPPNTTLLQLLKYAGSLLFDTKKHIIWQDAKFFRKSLAWKRPSNYQKLLQNDACVTTFGLPTHPDTVGKTKSRIVATTNGTQQQLPYHTKFKDHCNHVIGAIKTRPNVTDSADALSKQCSGYIEAVENDNKEQQQTGIHMNKNILNEGLIDSAIIFWNHASEECRSFNDRLRCTMLDQINCHSDRDQPAFPFILHTFGFQDPVYNNYKKQNGTKIVVNFEDWNTRIHDLDFHYRNDDNDDSNKMTMVRIVRSNCHWYYGPVGKKCDFWK